MSSDRQVKVAAGCTPDRELVPRHPIEGMIYHRVEDAKRHLERGDWLDLTVGESLRRTAAVVPGKAAVIDHDGSLTFAELDRQSESVAASLLALGLEPGDRALFQVGTCREFFTAFYGCMKAGIVPVCTLPQYRATEMRHFAEATSAKAILVQADLNPRYDQIAFAQELTRTVPALRHVIVVRGERTGACALKAMASAYALEAARSQTAVADPSVMDVATFQLSGGSTNLPKIIPRIHGEYLGATIQLSRRYELNGDDVTLWSLPLVHNAGTLFVVLPVGLEGRTLVLQPRVDISEMLTLVERHKVTFSGSIGPVAAKLLEVPDFRSAKASSLRQFFSLARADAVEAHVGIPVGQMFGMTEGMVFAAAPSTPAGPCATKPSAIRYRPATTCVFSCREPTPMSLSARSENYASVGRAR